MCLCVNTHTYTQTLLMYVCYIIHSVHIDTHIDNIIIIPTTIVVPVLTTSPLTAVVKELPSSYLFIYCIYTGQLGVLHEHIKYVI